MGDAGRQALCYAGLGVTAVVLARTAGLTGHPDWACLTAVVGVASLALAYSLAARALDDEADDDADPY